MAKNVVTTSDVSGEPNARTYSLTFDGQEWSVDLTDPEVAPILKVFQEHGRLVREGTAQALGTPRGLESRIRNVPETPAGA